MRGVNLGDKSLYQRIDADAYLNYAAVSPPGEHVREAFSSCLDVFSHKGVGAALPQFEARESLRVKLGELIHAARPEHEIAFMPNTTSGVIACARALKWSKGDRILVFDGDFPANVLPWQDVARAHELEIVWGDLRQAFEGDLTAIEAQLKQGLRLVAISAVTFQTGWQMPLGALGALCAKYGAELFVDAIQACGVMPLDVQRDNISYLACGGHKWLMGTEGAGFLYVSSEALENSLERAMVGWLSPEEPFDFLSQGSGYLRYDKRFKESASFLEVGAMNAMGYAGLSASVDALLHLGVDRIFEHVNTYLDRVEEGLVALPGVRSVRGSERATQTGALCLEVDLPQGMALSDFSARLGERGVAVSTPDGYVRLAPHWPNSFDEIPLVLGSFAAVLAGEHS